MGSMYRLHALLLACICAACAADGVGCSEGACDAQASAGEDGEVTAMVQLTSSVSARRGRGAASEQPVGALPGSLALPKRAGQSLANGVAILAIAFVLASCALGLRLAMRHSLVVTGVKTPPVESSLTETCATTLVDVVGQALLFFGWFITSFSCLLVAAADGQEVTLTSPANLRMREVMNLSESIFGFVRECLRSTSPKARAAGGLLIALSAGMPCLRIMMAALGRRLSGRRAWGCLVAVRHISKLAWPALFLTILVYCQCKFMEKPPVISVDTALDVGFVCYSCFCVSSIMSSFFVKLPPVLSEFPVASVPNLWGVRRVSFWALVYVALLACGLSWPSFAYNASQLDGTPVHKASLDAVRGTRMNLWQCLGVLIDAFSYSKQVTTLLAFLMVVIFCILCPLLDIAALALTMLYQHRCALRQATVSVAVSRFARVAALLDMLIVGMLLAALAGRLQLLPGIIPLIVAEIIKASITEFAVEPCSRNLGVDKEEALALLGPPRKCQNCDFLVTGLAPLHCCRACQHVGGGEHGMLCQRMLATGRADLAPEVPMKRCRGCLFAVTGVDGAPDNFCCQSCFFKPGTHGVLCSRRPCKLTGEDERRHSSAKARAPPAASPPEVRAGR